jgi:hypothetical protein
MSFVVKAAAEAVSAAGSLPEAAVQRANRALIQVGEAVHAAEPGGPLAVIVENAASQDTIEAVPGVRPNQIAQLPLWLGRGPPEFIGERWEALKQVLQSADQGWEVWIDWYEARLDGRLRV